MTAEAQYNFRYYSADGVYITDLDNFISAEFGRTKNDTGAASILLPLDIYDTSIFNEDCILEIWRYANGAANLVGNTCWFLRKITMCLKDGCDTTAELVFYDTIELLRRRVNAWFLYEREEIAPGIWNQVNQYPSNLLENAHDVLVDLFIHNFQTPWTTETRFAPTFAGNRPAGILSAVDRSMSDNTFPIGSVGLLGAGATSPRILHASAFENVLDSMKKAAQSSLVQDGNLWFDIVYTPSSGFSIGTFNFTVWEDYRGNNLADDDNTFVISPEFGSLAEACLTFDYTTAFNVAYATTQDEVFDTALNIKEILVLEKHTTDYNILPFGPIESVVQLSNSSTYTDPTATGANRENIDPAMLEQVAYEGLYTGRSKLDLTGNILQVPGSQLFIHYNYGDVVRVNAFGQDFSAEINSFVINIDNNGIETITIPLTANFLTTRAAN